MRTLLEFLRSVKASTNKIDSAQISRCVSNVWYFWEMVSVVIPVYNKVELTNRCLDSLISNSRALSEVFVVDNASTDSTPETLLQWRVRFQELNIPLRILKNEKNEGFGRACNQGIRLATGDFVAIVNNDTWMMKGWDQALIDETSNRELDEVGPFFDERPWTENPQARADEFLRRNLNGFRQHFVAMLMFFTRSAVDRLRYSHGGLFDERFFVTFEDGDLLQRMKIAGIRYGQTSRCYIWHHSKGTRGSGSLLPTNYEQEGRRLFEEKWGGYPVYLDHTLLERLKRRYRALRAARGMF